jgi:hypothetical protein
MMKNGICRASKGSVDGRFNTTILPNSEASVKVKPSMFSTKGIDFCLVYELVDQRNESEPLMEDDQVFIAVNVVDKSHNSKREVSAAIFKTRKGQFIGKKGDMKRLKEVILRKNSDNNAYAFICSINDQILRLEALFHPGKQASIKITREEPVEDVVTPVLFE